MKLASQRFGRAFALALLAAALLPAGGVARPIDGLVFLDGNANGRHDEGEAGIADVKLSNGRDVVRSDAQGRYRIELHDGDTLFLIKPADYALPRRADGMPAFWQHERSAAGPALRYRGIGPTRADGVFALQPQAAAAVPMEVLVFGDPQPRSAAEVDYFRRDIVEPIIGKHAAMLGLSLGDIVHDDLTLLPGVRDATAQLGLPWLHAAGNHDLDFDAAGDADSLLSFRAVFGPDTFAREEAAANFVVFDDVIYLPDRATPYVGGLREDQFAFLENYLPTLDRSRLLVLAAHIPLFDGRFRAADRSRLFGLLREFPHVLLLTAHSHTQRHVFHGADNGWHGAKPLHEYNVGAACGGFWAGEPDASGIPDARMADGTPNGYALLRVSADASYQLRWFVARGNDDEQIALHAPRVLKRGAYPQVGLFANVYMGLDDSRVEYRIDDEDWQPMQRVLRADPRVLYTNLNDDMALRLSHRRMPEADPSHHLWRATLPTDRAAGPHRIEVRAFDPWHGELRAATEYRLDE